LIPENTTYQTHTIMHRTLFLFTAILITTSLAAQDLRQMRLVGEPHKLDSELVARRDNDGNYCAAIQVISDMDGFSYDAFDGVVGNVDSRPGMDIVYLKATERVLEIYKTGYQPLKLILSEHGIRLAQREVWQVTLAGDELINALPVVIRFTPDDATLFINNTLTPKAATYSLTLGQHNLRIVKDGFQPMEESITVNEQNIFFEYTMQRQPDAALQVETTPAGATVYLDGVNLGESPVAVFYKPGVYPIRIVKDGYVTLENQTLEVKLPQTRKSYNLEENVGYITINTHSGATVFFNDQRINNPKNVKLPPQLVRIKVSMPKAETLEQQVVLRRNDRLALDMFPDVQTATLQIAVTPFDAKIELTGDAGEKFSAEGMKIFENIPVGTYTIKVSATGHDTKQETLTLKTGERLNRSIKLNETSAAQPAVAATTSGFRCGSNKLVDTRDGNEYETVQIGNQCWMKENLKWLPNVSPSNNGSNTSAHYYVYGYQGSSVSAAKATANYQTYGVLYNWPAALKACPQGWHLPSDSEWTVLYDHLGGGSVAGGKMKTTGTTHWRSPNTGATNSSGFSGLPGGSRSSDGSFGSLGYYGYWWSSTEYSSTSAWSRYLYYYPANAYRYYYYKELGFSVRCVRD
jgi:uncharacterized protein (TIGR02145 family)